jgi:hypothetical protein
LRRVATFPAANVEHMTFERGDHVFVDESKERGYYIAAAATARGDVAAIEARLRKLRTGSRSTIHFTKETKRRDLLLREFCTMDVRVTLYVMRGAKDVQARPALLRALVADLVAGQAGSLTIENDQSVQQVDRRTIRDELDRRRALGSFAYDHADRSTRPLLWIADAAAWCHQAGGAWPGKVAPIVQGIIEIERP